MEIKFCLYVLPEFNVHTLRSQKGMRSPSTLEPNYRSNPVHSMSSALVSASRQWNSHSPTAVLQAERDCHPNSYASSQPRRKTKQTRRMAQRPLNTQNTRLRLLRSRYFTRVRFAIRSMQWEEGRAIKRWRSKQTEPIKCPVKQHVGLRVHHFLVAHLANPLIVAAHPSVILL